MSAIGCIADLGPALLVVRKWPQADLEENRLQERRHHYVRHKKSPGRCRGFQVSGFVNDQYFATTGPPNEYPTPTVAVMFVVRLGGSKVPKAGNSSIRDAPYLKYV